MFCERHDRSGLSGHTVRMNDSRLNIVERPALFLTIKADNQRSAMRRQVQIIRDNIDNTIHGQPEAGPSSMVRG